MTPLAFEILATVAATLVILVLGSMGVKKSDPLMVLAAVSFALPTVGFGTGVCLRALAALIS